MYHILCIWLFELTIECIMPKSMYILPLFLCYQGNDVTSSVLSCLWFYVANIFVNEEAYLNKLTLLQQLCPICQYQMYWQNTLSIPGSIYQNLSVPFKHRRYVHWLYWTSRCNTKLACLKSQSIHGICMKPAYGKHPKWHYIYLFIWYLCFEISTG